MARDFEVTVRGTEQVQHAFYEVGEKSEDALIEALAEAAIDIRDEWKRNIEASAGDYAKHYKRSIRYNVNAKHKVATIKPDRRFKQSGMSFEYGSDNQPPHLDGLRALERYGPTIVRRINAKLAFL